MEIVGYMSIATIILVMGLIVWEVINEDEE